MTKKLLALYGLKWNPFLADVPPEALFVSPGVDSFAFRLENLVREGGFALITGDPGTGKSVVCRLLAHRLQQLPELEVGVLSRPQSRLADFYREIGDIFSVNLSPHNRWGGFKSLREKWRSHLASTLLRPVLFVDEAQQMLGSVMSELRLLSSVEFDSKNILTVVLSGDARLLELFHQPELLPLASRIRVRLSLDYQSPDELANFLRSLMTNAGNPQLMTDPLIETLAEHAAGNYRVLCSMATELLATAAQKELPQIDEKLFLETFASQTSSSPGRRRAGAASLVPRA
ncbi:MAG: AAA family ATPase [Vicinamibacteria bacterium]